MTTEPRYARPPELAVVRTVEGNLYLMALPDGLPRVLNGSAQVIWDVAVSGSKDIVSDVAALFDVEPETIASDVQTTLAFLARARLIEQASDGGGA